MRGEIMKQSLKVAWTGFAAGVKAQYPGRDSNLKCEYIEGEFIDQNTLPFVLPIKNHVQNHNYADAVVIIDSYLHKRVFTAQGLPLYSKAAKELEQGFQDTTKNIANNEKLLSLYLQWYQSRPDCPYAAAAYADGLQTTGHSHRGTDWAHKVKPKQWEAMQRYNQQAQNVYEATRSKFQNHWYWSKNYLHFALTSGVNSSEIWRRFQNCINANPYDYQIYDIMAYMMLPRWHGTFEDVEKVALKGVEATQKYCGNMMYAKTLTSIFDYHYLSELKFDWPKLKSGFEDWLRLFPSDYVKTYYACCAYTMAEHGLALQLLESLDKFYIQAWDADEDIYVANSICREFKKNYPQT